MRDQTHIITQAPPSRLDELRIRQRNYGLAMALRTVMFVSIFFTSGLMMWVMAIGAIVIPYVAVIYANAGRERPPLLRSILPTPRKDNDNSEPPKMLG